MLVDNDAELVEVAGEVASCVGNCELLTESYEVGHR